MDPTQAFKILALMQMGFMLTCFGVGFGCGYMFCKEKFYAKEKPSRQRDRAKHKSLT